MTIQVGPARAYLFSLTAVRLEGVGVVEANPGLGKEEKVGLGRWKL